jgi:hypothetical protein
VGEESSYIRAIEDAVTPFVPTVRNVSARAAVCSCMSCTYIHVQLLFHASEPLVDASPRPHGMLTSQTCTARFAPDTHATLVAQHIRLRGDTLMIIRCVRMCVCRRHRRRRRVCLYRSRSC